MTQLNIHKEIHNKLNFFIQNNQIPNILLHGPPGSGKRYLLKSFIDKIYNETNQNLIMYVECGHGKGIKFIRDEVNYFAKTNCNEHHFKTIVLLNADKLTIDAQSALRRSIEMFCKSTRYFIILHDKKRLLNPLLSRFCELFIPFPIINNKITNLHEYFKDKKFDNLENQQIKFIKNKFSKLKDTQLSQYECYQLSDKLYNKGISALVIIKFMKTHNFNETTLLIAEKLRNHIKSEKLLIFSILLSTFLRSNFTYNNILSF